MRVGWGLAGLRALSADADVVVVVDVLSFSTACAVAAEQGAVVLPWDPDTPVPATTVDQLVAGPRGSGTWSLSPASLRALPSGARLVLPSPNGSRLCAWARARGIAVHTACLRDRHLVAARLEAASVVAVIAAGEHWPDPADGVRFALEDWLGAGAVVDALAGSRSPEAGAAEVAYRAVASELESVLRATASGRELVRQGFAEDVRIAAGA